MNRFRDRATAGKGLAAVLGERDYQHPLVLGIPRGGMVVAAEVAKILAAELGILVSRKLEASYQPELTIGAVTADGTAYVDSVVAEEVGANQRYLLKEQRRQAAAAKRLEEELDGFRSYVVRERPVLVITDGVATGASVIAAVRSLEAAGATRVIVATPVAPPDALSKLRSEAEDLVCLSEAPGFLSVAQFYDHFPRVDSGDIRALLGP